MDIIAILNNNKVFAGCMMILMNIGGRHILTDLPKNMDKVFDNVWMRRFIVFCIAFVATRDINIAIFIMLMYILLFTYMLDENFEFNIFRFLR